MTDKINETIAEMEKEGYRLVTMSFLGAERQFALNPVFKLESSRLEIKIDKEERVCMEWLPIAVVAVLIVIVGIYFIVKKAVKDALKEYFRDENKG